MGISTYTNPIRMTHPRRNFLKASGMLGLASVLPSSILKAEPEPQNLTDTCVLIPSETAGPFPLDLTENTTFFRQDLREGKAGVPFRVRLKILGAENCLPMPNVRVNIWHCDKDGLYSGYSQTNNPGQAGLTYLRGYQFTDAEGIAEFITIFPGWYTGRICHIHFQVYVSSSYSAVSQLSFDVSAKQALYSAHSDLYTNGQDPMTFASDNVFSDGYQYQLASLTEAADIDGYESYLEVTVQGSGVVTSSGYLEKQNALHFELGQNHPNPYTDRTEIPLLLTRASNVELDVYALDGKIVHQQTWKALSAGKHTFPFAPGELGLPATHYVYNIRVNNEFGTFGSSKMMTVAR